MQELGRWGVFTKGEVTKVHTISELSALIQHTSKITVVLFCWGVWRKTMHWTVFDAGCNTNATKFAFFQTMVNAGSRRQMSLYWTNHCNYIYQHQHHKYFNSFPLHGWWVFLCTEYLFLASWCKGNAAGHCLLYSHIHKNNEWIGVQFYSWFIYFIWQHLE